MLTRQHNPRVHRTISSCRWQSIYQHDGCKVEEEEEEGEEEDDGACNYPSAATIGGLCDTGHLHMAVELMEQQKALLPQGIYWSLLKLCNKCKALHHAKHVHAHIHKHSVLRSLPATIQEYLILTLVKCGDLESALEVFRMLPNPTVFAWTAVISGYADCGEGERALEVYAGMLEESICPNEYTYVSLFRACSRIPNLEVGKALHVRALGDGLCSHVIVVSSLVSMYGKCGSLADAEKAFSASRQPDVVLWTSMLSVCIEYSLVKEALSLYIELQKQGIAPNEWTISSCLQGCSVLTENKQNYVLEEEPGYRTPLETGLTLHADACYRGFDSKVFVCNSLLRMYGKCGCFFEAENLFIFLTNHNVVSWTTMLSLYVEHGKAEKALKVYRQMQENDLVSDKLIFVIVLQACAVLAASNANYSCSARSCNIVAFEIGQALHADARRKNLNLESFAGNTLVHLYAKCAKYAEAEAVFAELCQRDVVSWTVMLPAYIEQGQARKALQLYQQMQEEGVSPDERMFINVFQACVKYANEESEDEEGNLTVQTALEVGKALHSDAVDRGFDQSVYLCSVLVNLYSHCKSIIEAEYSFQRLPQPDVTVHSALLSAYVKDNQGVKALRLYKEMLMQGLMLDDSIYHCMLQSCCATRSLEDCRHLHHSILWTMRKIDLALETGLVYAYACCASASDAQVMLNSSCVPDVVSWNAFIAGSIQAGHHNEAFQRFEDMLVAGVKPNEVTMLSLLSACCQIGLLRKGVDYLQSMKGVYGMTPQVQHYGCVIDLLGRSGDFNRIVGLLFTMETQPDLAMWLGLLGACQVYGNAELGKLAYDHAIRLQPKQAAAYVLMSSVYADAGMQDQASEVEQSRQKASAWKKPGKSWIVINERTHTFVVKENMAFQEEYVFHVVQKRHRTLKLEGHIPQTNRISS